MNRKPFVFIVLLSILYFVLTVLETGIYQKWSATSEQERYIQIRLAEAAQYNDFTQRFLRRIAIDSVHDPALADVLKKHGLKITINNPPAAAVPLAPSSAPASPAPPASNFLHP